MQDAPDPLEEFLSLVRERAGPLHRSLADQGVRIFALSLEVNGKQRTVHWIHDRKSVEEWRQDVRDFLASSEASDDPDTGRAEEHVSNALTGHLVSLGYVDVDDVAADVFEGRVTNERARLIHEPAHEEQPDGFGHYGWERGHSGLTPGV